MTFSYWYGRGGLAVDDVGIAAKRAPRCSRTLPDLGGHVGLRRDGTTQVYELLGLGISRGPLARG